MNTFGTRAPAVARVPWPGTTDCLRLALSNNLKTQTAKAPDKLDSCAGGVAYHFGLFQKLLRRLGEFVLQEEGIHAFVKITRYRVLRRHFLTRFYQKGGAKRKCNLCAHV